MKNVRRILYVNPTSKTSGAEFSLLALMSHLPRSRYEPILLCPTEGLLPELARQQNIPVYFLPTIPPPAGRAIDTYRTLPQNAWRIKQLIKELKIDLVHSNSPRMAYHSGLAARWAKVPHITHVRNISDSPFASPPKARFLDHLSDQIITVSEATKAMIGREAPYIAQKTQVVYNGVQNAPQFDAQQIKSLRAEFEFDHTSQTFLLAIIGQVTAWKGHEVALRALPTVLKQYPNTRLLIVGKSLWSEGEVYKQHLANLVKELDLSEHVLFTGFRQDIPLMLASLDLLIHCPIKPDPLPRILLEAGAQETLIVASRIGGIPEQVLDGETGFLVQPNQPQELAQAIIKALTDHSLATHLRIMAGKRMRDLFSIEQHVTRIEAIYNLIYAKR